MQKTGGGTFDPSVEHLYFLAANMERLRHVQALRPNLLIAVNELQSAESSNELDEFLDAGITVFLDSGIYNLAMEHARKHGTTHDAALGLAPDEIDGFYDLWERYLTLVERYGDRLWGYIELDQGGRENKIKTRAKLESLGLRPIPVYHPLNDGWDYFDELARNYDRICFGNIVQADPGTRKRLLATAWERRRDYPDLWIHLLGMRPNQVLHAYPVNSADASTWLSAVRWSGYVESANGTTMGGLPKHFQYRLGSDPEAPHGNQKAARMAAFGGMLVERNWLGHLDEMRDLGMDERGGSYQGAISK